MNASLIRPDNDILRLRWLIAAEQFQLCFARSAPPTEDLQLKCRQLEWSLAARRFQIAYARHVQALIKAGFNPDQPRVPAGNPDGGQWTSAAGNGRLNDPHIVSDVTPDNDWKPGARYAQNPTRGGRGPILINGQWVQPTPGQAARLAIAEARAQDAIRQLRDIDPTWRPTPSLSNTVEGYIASIEAATREARARFSELARNGIGPGPFAGESIPARGPERDFTASERAEINRIGTETGCHTCGVREAGTFSGNFVPDHQPPNALNRSGRQQRLYPQCITCSDKQGLWIAREKGRAR